MIIRLVIDHGNLKMLKYLVSVGCNINLQWNRIYSASKTRKFRNS